MLYKCCMFAILTLLSLLASAEAMPSIAALQNELAANAVPAFKVSSQSEYDRTLVGSGMLLLIDKTGTKSVEEVLADDQSWEEIHKESPNFGFSNNAYWFRFNIDNVSAKNLTRFAELPIPFLDDIQLYHFVDGQLQTSYHLGDGRPFAERPIRHQNFVMPLDLAPGTNALLMRISSAGTVEAPLVIWKPLYFFIETADARLLQGVFAGIMIIMVVYNLFLFFSVRDISYLYYVGFVISFLLFQVCLKGYGYAYIWTDSVDFNSHCISTFVGLSEVTFGLFSLHFLRLKAHFPLGNRILFILIVISGLVSVLTFVLPYSWTIRITTGLVLPICFMAMFSGYWVWWKGGGHARFFCVASTAIILGIAVLVLGKFGLLPLNIWTENAAQIAALLQVSLLSFALADRINREKQLRINAQAEVLKQEHMLLKSQTELISAQESANRDLEIKVNERTQALQATLGQLEAANQKLHELSVTDGLTQIHNRAFFTEQFAQEYLRAHRQKIPLSIILCDIDYFKSINDNYGHIAGDQCLVEIAKILNGQVARTGDVLARYGGEEFIIMLVNTPLEAAISVAESLREKIGATRIHFNHHAIELTASFGVACDIPGSVELQHGDEHTGIQANSERPDGGEALIQRADEALYRAKSDGRNCVRN